MNAQDKSRIEAHRRLLDEVDASADYRADIEAFMCSLGFKHANARIADLQVIINEAESSAVAFQFVWIQRPKKVKKKLDATTSYISQTDEELDPDEPKQVFHLRRRYKSKDGVWLVYTSTAEPQRYLVIEREGEKEALADVQMWVADSLLTLQCMCPGAADFEENFTF